MIIGLILLILLIIVFLLISAAVIYHLYRYTPEKNNAALLIAIYIAISFILLIMCLIAFGRIEWNNLM
jgi:hypothetical protein